jgi:DtxR family manganese transport transcriptional regulator
MPAAPRSARATAARAKVRPSPTVEALRQTRAAHANELAEDYVEAIAALAARCGEARLVDLARELGVTHVTVHRAILRLARAGLVTSEPYRAIFLTETGRTLAETCRTRHETVFAFLRSLGVPEAVARRDAEGLEHHVSPETLAAFAKALPKG